MQLFSIIIIMSISQSTNTASPLDARAPVCYKNNKEAKRNHDSTVFSVEFIAINFAVGLLHEFALNNKIK